MHVPTYLLALHDFQPSFNSPQTSQKHLKFNMFKFWILAVPPNRLQSSKSQMKNQIKNKTFVSSVVHFFQVKINDQQVKAVLLIPTKLGVNFISNSEIYTKLGPQTESKGPYKQKNRGLKNDHRTQNAKNGKTENMNSTVLNLIFKMIFIQSILTC